MKRCPVVWVYRDSPLFCDLHQGRRITKRFRRRQRRRCAPWPYTGPFWKADADG